MAVERALPHHDAGMDLGIVDPGTRDRVLRHRDDEIERRLRRVALHRMRGENRRREHAAVDGEHDRETIRRRQVAPLPAARASANVRAFSRATLVAPI